MTNKTSNFSAFESWNNGGTQISGFHTGQDAVDFADNHDNSGSFAKIHFFDSIEEGEKSFRNFCDKINSENS
jgi:hypothetical protein